MVRQPSALIQRAEIDEKLRKAVDLHRSGQLERAEQIYREILCDAPKHADALHLLGVVAYQVGKCAVAVDLVSQEKFNRIVIWHNRGVSDIPLDSIAGKSKTINKNDPLIKVAEGLGIYVGEL